MTTIEIPRSSNGASLPAGWEHFDFRLAPRMRAALNILLDALDYARDMNQSSWNFAVEFSHFRRLKLSNSDLRWLVAREFIDHAVEVTTTADCDRTFHQPAQLRFGPSTCFVLSAAGAALARRLLGRAETNLDGRGVDRPLLNFVAASPLQVPRWDSDRQELWVGSDLVKRFRVPAASQEAVLSAFEEEHWPPRIDDPLSPRADQSPKRRLQETIKSLNKNQKRSLIRFLGDGSGQGVLWELCIHRDPPTVLSERQLSS